MSAVGGGSRPGRPGRRGGAGWARALRSTGWGARAAPPPDVRGRPREPVTRGDPMRPLLWVSKSHDKLAVALQKLGHKISANSVKRLLPKLGYSRQENRKADQGTRHPDRNAQFEHINAKVIAAQAAGQPVISVDTKKKELVGNYKNGGPDYRPKGDPRRVKVHDFEDKELGKVVPYGVYDVTANAGWVSVGVTSDTAQFAVASLRRWLAAMGGGRHPQA